MRYFKFSNQIVAAAVLELLVAIVCLSIVTYGQSSPQKLNPAVHTTYVLEPITISNIQYPPSAREQKIQGQVRATMLISEKGTVEHIQVFKADPILASAVEEATKGWQFRPILKDGSAISVIALLVCKFDLGSANQPPSDIVPEIAPATEFPKSVRVSDSVMKGMVIDQPAPVYPLDAKSRGIQGTVVLRATITTEGAVTNIEVVSGNPDLVQPAIEAVRHWRYRSYLLVGRPVEVETQMQINFSLR